LDMSRIIWREWYFYHSKYYLHQFMRYRCRYPGETL
jgi:hypothetical protein